MPQNKQAQIDELSSIAAGEQPAATDSNAPDSADLNTLQATKEEEGSIVIHTMPKEFLGAKEKKMQTGENQGTIQKPPKMGNKKFLIILAVFVILFIGGGAAAYIVLIRGKDTNSEVIAPPIVEPVIDPVPTDPITPVETGDTGNDTTNTGGDTESGGGEQNDNGNDDQTASLLGEDLVQKVVVSYNNSGSKTTEAVLSLEHEDTVNYSKITITEHIAEKKSEYFEFIAGQAYEVRLRGEMPSAKSVLSITFTQALLEKLDLIPADLRIGFLPFARLDENLYRTSSKDPKPTSSPVSSSSALHIVAAHEEGNPPFGSASDSSSETPGNGMTLEEAEKQIPPPPSGITGEVTGDGVKLTWKALRGSVGTYHIYRKQGEESEFKKINSTFAKEKVEEEGGIYEFVDTDVRAAVTYTYAITVVNTFDKESDKSESVKVLVPSAPGDAETNSLTVTDPQIWEILKAQDLDDNMYSISSVLQGVREGIYAIVPINVNDLIKLPEQPIEPPDEPPVENGEIVAGLDSDLDVLTDKEELIYGTSPLVADSDLDGYNDGTEVLGLFSPARGKGVSLSDDTQFARYVHREYHYSVLYPKQFTPKPLVQDSNKDIIFVGPGNESILISIQDNKEGLDLKTWVLSLSSGIDISKMEEIRTKGGFEALGIANKTAYYVQLSGSPFVYVFSYTSPDEYDYLTTMRMMLESFMEEAASPDV